MPGKTNPTPSSKIAGLELFEKPIPVPEVPDPEDPLVAGTRRALEGATIDEYGILRPLGQEILDIEQAGSEADEAIRDMATALLLVARYHTHRGTWRRRRGR